MGLTHWLYSVILFLPASVRLAEKIISETGGIASRYGPLLAMALLAVGFIASEHNKPVFNRIVWRGSFWLLAVLSGLAGLYGIILLVFSGSITAGLGLLIMALIPVPALRSVYRYSAATSPVWAHNK